jgi:sugar lactone lactonase YvrE
MSKTAEANAGNLYCLKPNHNFEAKIRNTTISNGLAWSADGKSMYFIDSIYNSVKHFTFSTENANFSNEKIVIENPEMKYFDGMTIDSDGMLWVAHFGGSCVRRWNPNTGEVLLKIELPCPNITSLTFGGKDYTTLYITTSQENMSDADRLKFSTAGAIFHLETEFQGLETNVFG